MGRVGRILLIGICLAIFFGQFHSAQAQVTTGSISGAVVDPSGAAVPAAAVNAVDSSLAISASAQTDRAGIFKLNFLPVGQYTITIGKTGFQTYKSGNVSVTVNTDTGLGSVVLALGPTATTVEVTAGSPLIESTGAQVTNTFEDQVVRNFAGIVENQGMDSLALQIPGVVNTRDLTSFVNFNGVGFGVNGLRGHENDQQVDGQYNVDNSLGGPALFVQNTDFISEYQIVTENFGPEYGRNAGSVVNQITRSGTNQWHGTAYAAETNSVFQTLTNQQKEFLDLKKVPHYNEIFPSATIGGPAWKDRVFVFGGFDTEINSSETEASSGNLAPTPTGVSQLAACWPGSNSVKALQAYGPFGITQGSPQILPGSLTTADYSGAVVPNDGGTGCNVQLGGVERSLTNSVHEYDGIYKTDVVLSNADRFFGRYMFQKTTSFNVFGNGAAGYPVSNPVMSQMFLLDWTHTFSGTTVNEFRVGYERENAQFGGNTLGNTVPERSQMGSALADIYFANPSLMGFGPQPNYPQGRVVNTYQLQDNLAHTVGRHELKTGINLTYQRTPSTSLQYYNGFFEFSDWGNFAANQPSLDYIAQGNPELGFKEYDTFLYAGDDWKIRNNLTLNLGLTWSYDGQPFNLLHDLTVKQQTSSNPFWNPALPMSDTTLPSLPSIKHLFGPGAGFAWAPKSHWLFADGTNTVIRGGYRLAFDPAFYGIYLEFPNFAPLSFAQGIVGNGGSPTPALPAVPTGVNVRSELASYLTPGVYDPRSFTQIALNPNFGPDTVSSWSLGIQRAISPAAAIEIRYVGNHATNLLQSVNGNPYIAGLAAEYPNLAPAGVTPCASGNVPPAGGSSVATGRVNCNEGKVWQINNSGYSDYNALQAELRTSSLFRQLTLQTAYTFSKTTDDTTDIWGTGSAGNSTAFAQDVLNYRSAEHGISGLDIPNDWTLSFIEEIPFLKNQRGTLGKALGGWIVSGTYVVASGQPYTPLQDALNVFTGGVANDYSFNSYFGTYDTSRPFWGNPAAPANSVGIYAGDACLYTTIGCAISPTQLISFNAVNASGTVVPVSANQVRYIANGGTADSVFGTPFGSVPRNAARDYWTNVANFSLYKNFTVTERTTLQWHMTMTNVFNHPNFGTVSPGIDPYIEDAGLTSEGVGFGTPTLENGGYRQIFFGLKLIY